MNVLSAIVDFYRRGVRFDGRSSRTQFWWALPYLVTAGLLLTLAFGLFGADTRPAPISLFTVSGEPSGNPVDSITAAYQLTMALFWLVHVIPLIALVARRIHDAGFSRAWVLLGPIPLLGALTLLVLTMGPSLPRTGKPVPSDLTLPGTTTDRSQQ